MTALYRPNNQVHAKYSEFAPYIAGAYQRHLIGWKRIVDGAFEPDRIYEILFLGCYTSSIPWSILAFWKPRDPPPFTASPWQWGDGGQGFSDTPTHWREVLL